MQKVAEAIGYVLYAVASADKRISTEEKQVIEQYLRENQKKLVRLEDPTGKKSVEIILKKIDFLLLEKMKSEMAFQLFSERYQTYKKLFSAEIKQLIIDLCIKAAVAVNRMNKSELVVLSQIELLLK
jgi:ABC-type Zn uptake system ZnuABC Zn-binding protein ZnuA